MSVKYDRTPTYRCPVCFSPLFLDDEENGIWRCTNDDCLKVREVIVRIETFNEAARWAWEDEQDLKIPYRRRKGRGRSGKRHKVKRPKPRRWYEVDRSATEHGQQKAGQGVADQGTSREGQDPGSDGRDEPQ